MKQKILILLVSILFVACSLEAQNNTKPEKNDKLSTAISNTEPLKIGDTAPDFSLNDRTGKTVQLSKANLPVVVVFYRGYW